MNTLLENERSEATTVSEENDCGWRGKEKTPDDNGGYWGFIAAPVSGDVGIRRAAAGRGVRGGKGGGAV